MKALAYFTLGYTDSYLEITKYAILSLLYYNKEIDILILIDEQFYQKANELYLPLSNKIKIISTPNTKSAPQASMRKLQIFDYNIQIYDVVVYIDSDILIDRSLDEVFNNISKTDKLCVGTEGEDFTTHEHIHWSLKNYTPHQLVYFKDNNIYAFNAGLFGFRPTNLMKTHFNSVRGIINSYTGDYFYEQSFMNYYFNLINCTDHSVFLRDFYILFPKEDYEYKKCIIHFCGAHCSGENKLSQMTKYINKFMPYILNNN